MTTLNQLASTLNAEQLDLLIKYLEEEKEKIINASR